MESEDPVREQDDQAQDLLGANESLPLVLTVAETSKALRLGRTATYDAVRLGAIPHLTVGRRILVPRSALLRMLNSVEQPRRDPQTAEEGAKGEHPSISTR